MRVFYGHWCVYIHRIGSKVFYVGKGRSERPYSSGDRNKVWKSYVEKIGSFDVVIDSWFKTEKEALEREAYLISLLGPITNIAGISGRMTSNRKSPKKRQDRFTTPFLISVPTLTLLGNLSKEFGISKTGVVELALRELAKKEGEA